MKSVYAKAIVLFLAVAGSSALFGQDISAIRPGGRGRSFQSEYTDHVLRLQPVLDFEAATGPDGPVGWYDLRLYPTRLHGPVVSYSGYHATGTYDIDNDGTIELSGHEVDSLRGTEDQENWEPVDGTIRFAFRLVESTPIIRVYEAEVEMLGSDYTFVLREVAAFVDGIPIRIAGALPSYWWHTTANSRVRSGPSTAYEYYSLRVADPQSHGQQIESFPFLPGDRRVDLLARTLKRYPIADWSDYWYYVRTRLEAGETGPEYGWMYGALLRGTDQRGP